MTIFRRRNLLLAIILPQLLLTSCAVDNNDAGKMISKGRSCLEKGDRQDAVKFFKKAIEISPDHPQAHLFLGKTYFLLQNNDEAISEFNKYRIKMGVAIESGQGSKETYINDLYSIGEVYFNLKMYEDFKDVTAEILKISPNDGNANYNMGVYYYVSEHNRPMAYRYFTKSADLSPSSAIGKKARYAIEFMRSNPDSRVAPDFSFIDKEYR